MYQDAPEDVEADCNQKFWDYFNMEGTSMINVTEVVDTTIPAPEQGFVVGVYSALLAAGAVGNVGVFVSLVRSRRRKSRVNLLMTHLVVADMIVLFIVIPLEIGWRTTNAWLAGNLACKFFLVLRAFGLYLSSNVLVCISLDRFFAILYPLRLPIARKRSKIMLSLAWIIALLCSLPQSLVFRVMSHPKVPDFQQCVSFEAFANQHQELAYNVFCLGAVYFLPLTIISVCYACIFYEISKNSKENSEKYHQSDHSRVMLRRSDQRPLARARRRTLRMTVTIVTVFACCWLPYATMTLWYMLDRKSAVHVSARVQDLFFIMAVSNSCMDPLVYGSYIIDPRTFKRTIRKLFCIHVSPSDIPGITGPDLRTKVSIRQPSRETTQLENIRLTCVRRHKVRFEELSTVRPSVNSDPIPHWAEHSIDDRVVKAARSCEIFVLHTPKRNFR
ncbi:adipokinetic hormone/corazonin-related peptide receptor variant I-like [Helicoverpa zea]|uniref:adipokinetic hormone/corazonin-related peptide receptor variant I-like n=1 Tax=Helicoverpa zea TaxID=7113 RepID=UPI001F58855F|nr:adipokinetic hormone/corazonin-related peptide receptor variant I-like [Helicoverpa zea]